MSTFVYPAYAPPINDEKLNEFWLEAFNINGRLHGLDVTEGSGVLHVATGAFLSNGCIVSSDSSDISLSEAPDEPYYLYGHFNYHDTNHLGVFGFGKLLNNGKAPIAKKSDGVWVMEKSITLKNLKDTASDHDTNSDIHITEDQCHAFTNASSPDELNLFVLETDLTSNLNTIEDDLRLLPFSIIGDTNIDSIIPHNPQETLIYDSFIIRDGILELIDNQNSTATYIENGYVDRILGTVLIGSDSVASVLTLRCSVDLSSSQPDFHKSQSIRVLIQDGDGIASMEWNPVGGLNFGDDVNYIQIPIFIPTDSNLSYIELIINDNVSTESCRLNYADSSTDEYNVISCPTHNLITTSINYVKINFKYANNAQSEYYYVGSLAAATTVKTINLANTTDNINTIRTSLLMHQMDKYELPKIDISIDGGTNWMYDIVIDKEIDVTTLEPVVTNEIKLCINLFNNGGDYYTTKTAWPIARPKSVLGVDSNSNYLVSMFGTNSSNIPQQTIHAYNRTNDTCASSLSTATARYGASSVNSNNSLSIAAGRHARSLSDSFYHKFSTSVNILKADLPEVRFDHGSDCDECREYVWKGIDSAEAASNSLRAYSIMGDSWASKTNATSSQAHSSGNLINNKIYTTNDELYNINTDTWVSSGISGALINDAISVKLKTNLIITAYQNAYGIMDITNSSSKAILLPLNTHRHSNSSMAAYDDDVVSFASWEYNSIQYNDHIQYTPYLATRLNGFVLRHT